ncbi:hypothetical protein JQ582_33095 [Bradyrhizobium japonicum]|uniref:hypothetical protein n=1 Tax=Bradyrhizobium japonicum TaxID=375 RepID=UPI001BA7D2E0|nr:hypothetical protein [Bradyrhizobium japonicum]MBR0748779.1 hypothetical protein [Bradyrhizobium japonicum]
MRGRSSARFRDFSPEQQKNIAAVVWLYRGQQDRFLKLVAHYLAEAVTLGAKAQKPLETYAEVQRKLSDLMEPFAKAERSIDLLAGQWNGLTTAQAMAMADIKAFGKEVAAQADAWAKGGRNKVPGAMPR